LLELLHHSTPPERVAGGLGGSVIELVRRHAAELVRRYELIEPANLYRWLSGLLSDRPGTVLDVGAGSGRDAAWLAAQAA